MLINTIIKGKLVGQQAKSFKTSKGEERKTNEVLIADENGIDTIILELPVDYKLVPNKDGIVEISGLQSTARQWDNLAKQFIYTKIRYYLPQK